MVAAPATVEIPGPGLRQATAALYGSASASVRHGVAQLDAVASRVGAVKTILDGAKTAVEHSGVADVLGPAVMSSLAPLSELAKVGGTAFSCAKAVLSVPGDILKVGDAIASAERGKKLAAGAAASSSLLTNLGATSAGVAVGISVFGLAVSPVPFVVGGIALGIAGAFAGVAAKQAAAETARGTAQTRRAAASAAVGGAVASAAPGVAAAFGGGRSQVQVLRANVESLIATLKKTRVSLETTERKEIMPKSAAVKALVGGSSSQKHTDALAGIVGAVKSMRTTQQELEAAERALNQIIQNI